MSDRESIEYDAFLENCACEEKFIEASRESALEQCIYLFVEGESEELAFRILLQEGLGINFKDYGVVIANYNGINNLKNTIRLMSKTLSHSRPMIFTFDDDNKSLIFGIGQVPSNVHLFKVPFKPVVTYPNSDVGGSFEESFQPHDFIEACFDTTLLKQNPNVTKPAFSQTFDSSKPFYKQIVLFLKALGLQSFLPSKLEIAEHMATNCESEPETYVKLAEFIKNIRLNNPVQVKM